MPPDIPTDEGPSEIAYGELVPLVNQYLVGSTEITGEHGGGIFGSADLLIKEPDFPSPDHVAQLVLDDGIEVIPGGERFVAKYRILPARLIATGETVFFYSPDNGQGAVDDPSQYHWDFAQEFQAISSSTQFEKTRLIIASHSDFQSIAGVVGNKDAAGKFLSVFDDISEGKINELIESVIAKLRKLGASDLHIEPGLNQAHILMRVHGMLQPIAGKFRRISLEVAKRIAHVLIQHSGETLNAGTSADGSFRFMPAGTIKQEDAGQGKIIATANPNLHNTEYRVSVIPAGKDSFSSVVRLLMRPEGLRDLGELGYEGIDDLLEAGNIANGLVFVCGPTGSGKTTTLAALLRKIHDPTKKTVTIENPIEVRMEGMVQSEVNPKKGYTMSTALRQFLRHDPDRILVAEVRDAETASLAVEAANTGHAVFTTIHANTAAQSIRRLLKLGIDSLDIASTVRFIFGQRLVEQLSSTHEYVEYYDATDELRLLFGEDLQGPVFLRRPLQSEGITGRIPIYERISMSDDMISYIEKEGGNVSSPEIEKIALQEGFIPMEIYGLRQVLLGKTSLAGLLRYINKARLQSFKGLALQIIQESGVREFPPVSS